MQLAFSDLPGEIRTAFWQAVESAGGSAVSTYAGWDVQVHVSNRPGAWLQLDRLARAFGLESPERCRWWYFPLTSAKVPDHLRHDGRYPGSRGFTLTACYRPKV